MKTDTLFYELFQTAPWTFFELLQIRPTCPYHFESITVKSTEKRIDGVLEPDREGATIYFLDIQAYPDKSIYWRTIREVATYFEQRLHLQENDWQAVVLFLDIADDPGFGTLRQLASRPSPRMIAADLLKLLKQLDDDTLSLNVLRPLVTERETEVRENVLHWAENIQKASDVDKEAKQRLVAILAQLIMQKFTSLTYKELSQMLKLTPLEETIDGKELLQTHSVKLLTKHIESKLSPSSQAIEAIIANLNKLDLESLEALFEEILKIETVEELETWIDNHIFESTV